MSVIDSRGNRIAKSEKEVSVMRQPVIISATRTAIGKFQGALKSFTAPQLGSIVVRAAVERAGLEASRIDEVIMGCALQAGLGQNPARQAALGAGLPDSVSALHHQSRLRIGFEGGDAGRAVGHARRQRCNRRGRDGVDVERALSVDEGPRWLSHGRRTDRSTR